MPIQIGIDENRLPRPFRRGEAGVISDFRKGAVAARHEESIAQTLGTIAGHARLTDERLLRIHLPFARRKGAAEHIEHENFRRAVEVQVGRIDTHGTGAGLPKGEGIGGAKFPLADVEPDSIRRPKVVADIKVRGEITIEVAEGGAETPIERCTGEWL